MRAEFVPRGKKLPISNYNTLTKGAEKQLAAPTLSFSSSMGETRKSVAGVFANEDILPLDILKAHIQQTLKRIYASKSEYILALQDTCDYSLNSHVGMKGLEAILKKVAASLKEEQPTSLPASCSNETNTSQNPICPNESVSKDKVKPSKPKVRVTTPAAMARKVATAEKKAATAKKKESAAKQKADANAQKAEKTKRILGIHQHAAIAVTEDNEFLGILNMLLWVTNGAGSEIFGEGKSSQKWSLTLEDLNELFGQQLQKFLKKLIVIADREADEFGYLSHHRNRNINHITRIYQERFYKIIQKASKEALLNDEKAEFKKLGALKDDLPKIGEKVIDVKHYNVIYRITLGLYAAIVDMQSPERAENQDGIQGQTMVMAKEINRVILNPEVYDRVKNQRKRPSRDPKESFELKPVLWIVLTNMELKGDMTAERIIVMYSKRWTIERYHYYTKTGTFNMERKQFDDVHTFMNALAFYGVLTWKMMNLQEKFVSCPDAHVSKIFNEIEIEALEVIANRDVHTVKDAEKVLMKLVNFKPCKKQEHMGVKKLGEAMEKFIDKVDMLKAMAVRNHRKKATG